MLLSTMLIGTVSTVNATTIDSDSNDFYLIGGMNDWSQKDPNWQLSTTDNNKYTGTFTIKGSSSNIEFKVLVTENIILMVKPMKMIVLMVDFMKVDLTIICR